MLIVRLSKKVSLKSLESAIMYIASDIGWQIKKVEENRHIKYTLINSRRNEEPIADIYVHKAKTMPEWLLLGERYRSGNKMMYYYLQSLDRMIRNS